MIEDATYAMIIFTNTRAYENNRAFEKKYDNRGGILLDMADNTLKNSNISA
ncbi:MAG: hypothetical protein LBH86_09650 [Oscillospiraceae bacterium]|nr:hypothetical protein [Oscillospiraceae bacterium]